MTVIEKIENQLSKNPILLYMKGTPYFPQCGFSGKVVQILQECEIEFAYVNIFDDAELRESLKEYSSWPTYPQLYVKGELVGGADIMIEMFESGELQTLLSSAETSAATETSDETAH